ncbi:MAG: hypothetical protein ABI691_09580 [Ginsengibacter sp.]
MKKFLMALSFMYVYNITYAQQYPEPEFSNEVYYLEKDTVYKTIRLEKESAKLDAKMKMGGFGGMENGYSIDDSKSTVRITHGNNLSFIFSTGTTVKVGSPLSDSLMNANGIDPEMMRNMADKMNNPLNNITLYKLETEKGKRKIIMQKSGGAVPFASKKIKSSDKYTFSIKKIREGYSELVIDKTLPGGEYAFSVPQNGMGGMGGDITLFAFGIE